jgi:ABC-type glycerol-3-phosphate transport system substrate-binding protein
MLFLFVVPLLAACGGPASNGPVTLVVWSNNASSLKTPGPAGDYARYIVSQFEKEHPNVTVKLEDHGWDEQLRQNLTTSLLGGTAPDVVVGESFFRQFAAKNALLPLDDVVGDIKDNLIAGTYQPSMYNGHIYTLSAYTGVFGFERNCKVVEKAGFNCNKPPQTWNELLQQTQAITQKGNKQYYGYTLQGPAGFSIGAVLRLAVYLSQANAPLCKNNCSEPWFNNPQAVPVYQFIRNLNKTTPPGLAFNSDEASVYSQMFKNKTAFQIAGSWYVNWSKQNGCQDCRYSVVPLPSSGHPASILVANVQYAALKQSKHQELAKQFVKFLTQDDVQSHIYQSIGNLPSTRSALLKLRPTVDPATQQFIDMLLHSDLQSLPQWTKNPQKVWTAYNNMLTKLLTTNIPVPQLLNEAQTQAEQAVNS